MGVNPAFRIVANDSDITAAIRERFVSLRLTDKTGLESDQIILTLADHDPTNPIALPPRGAELEVFLGYDDQVERMGLFIVDKVKANWPPDQIRITASANPQAASESGEGSTRKMMQDKKTRSWDEGKTLGSLTRTIAGEHGLSPVVQPGLADIALPHIDQTSESDMALMLRVASDYDAIAKPADGKLVVAKRGQSQSAGGEDLPAVALSPEDVTSGSIDISERRSLGTVKARYRDSDAGETVEIQEGNEEPVEELASVHPDEATARNAARSRLDSSRRAGQGLELNLPGDTRLMAEGRVDLSGFRDGANGTWLVTQVTHTVDSSGFSSSIKGEATG